MYVLEILRVVLCAEISIFGNLLLVNVFRCWIITAQGGGVITRKNDIMIPLVLRYSYYQGP